MLTYPQKTEKFHYNKNKTENARDKRKYAWLQFSAFSIGKTLLNKVLEQQKSKIQLNSSALDMVLAKCSRSTPRAYVKIDSVRESTKACLCVSVFVCVCVV